MDQITQILLTVGLNALVTGVFIYAFQKRMDARYAKKAFEDQIRFSDLYSKKVKTLEGVFQRFAVLERALGEMAVKTMEYMRSNPKERPAEFIVDQDDLEKKFQAFRNFYESNLLFLSENANDVVFRINFHIKAIKTVISYVADNHTLHSFPKIWLELLPPLVEVEDLIKIDLTETEVLLHKLLIELSTYSKQLEDLYKTEADLKP